MKKITLLLTACLCIMHAQAYSYTAIYSLTGQSMLSANADFEHPYWMPEEAINGIFTYPNVFNDYDYDGWWGNGEKSIIISFDQGATLVDKIQIVQGFHYSPSAQTGLMEGYDFYYTTDTNPTLSSNFMPLTDLSLNSPYNPTYTYLSNNSITMNQDLFEMLVQFSPVQATALKLTQYGNGIISELTIDEGNITVPEPMSIVLLSGSVIGLIRKYLKK